MPTLFCRPEKTKKLIELLKEYDSGSKSRKFAKYVPFWVE